MGFDFVTIGAKEIGEGGFWRLYGRDDEYYIYACMRCYSLAKNKVEHGPKR